jgi:small subunit ribosomal protein S2
MPENEKETPQAEAPADDTDTETTDTTAEADTDDSVEAEAADAPEADEEASADTDGASDEEASDKEASDKEASDKEDGDADTASDEEDINEGDEEETDEVEEPIAEDEEEDDDEEDEEEPAEHKASIEELLKAGTHFGHLTSRWHPRMEKYIFMDRNNIHIIDLMQTQVLLDRAASAARRFARRGKTILFAGTKKQAQEIVREYAEDCGMPFMVNRWLGGTMTNFQTIRRSIRRMEEIEKMERDGTLDKLKKKEKLIRLREHEKLENVLGGIREMANLPGAIFIVDVKREDIAVNEARKLGIPIIAMVDTNCDPELVDYPIPSNDDALSSIELVTSIITDAIKQGQQERQMKQQEKQKAKASA